MALSPRWADRLGSALGSAVISIVMSGVMSGVMVVLSNGLGPHVVEAWLKAWAIGLLVSFPTASLIVPPVVRWTGRLRAGPGVDRPFSLCDAPMMTTTTISDSAEICTLLNTFDVEPSRQLEVVDSLRRYTEKASRLAGFIAASVHASLDGRRVVNYVQWERREDLAAMLATDAAKAHMAEVGALAEAVDPVFYRVAFVGARSA